jgi:hypothetical protein
MIEGGTANTTLYRGITRNTVTIPVRARTGGASRLATARGSFGERPALACWCDCRERTELSRER